MLQSIPPAERKHLGIGPDLIRLSVGIEDSEDLLEDVQQALEYAVDLTATPVPAKATVNVDGHVEQLAQALAA